jgi:hypothetical protein
MLSTSFKNYLKNLKPTKSGIFALSLCLLIFPLFTDLFFVSLQYGGKKLPIMSISLINAYFMSLPLYIFYLFSYFLLLNSWNWAIKKLNIETLYFRS